MYKIVYVLDFIIRMEMKLMVLISLVVILSVTSPSEADCSFPCASIKPSMRKSL